MTAHPLPSATPPLSYRERHRDRLKFLGTTLPLALVQKLDSVAWDSGVSRAALLTYLLSDLPASGPELQTKVRLACDAHGLMIHVRQADGTTRRDTRGAKR